MLVKVKQVAKEPSSPSVAPVRIIVVIVIVIPVTMIAAVMLLVKPVLCSGYFVYFAPVKPYAPA